MPRSPLIADPAVRKLSTVQDYNRVPSQSAGDVFLDNLTSLQFGTSLCFMRNNAALRKIDCGSLVYLESGIVHMFSTVVSPHLLDTRAESNPCVALKV